MVRIILFLCLIILNSNANASCYASQWNAQGPVIGSLYVDNGTSLYACQQLACEIYPMEAGCSTAGYRCQTAQQTQTQACPQNYSGVIIQANTATCPTPYGQQVWSGWVTVSNTCTPNPPTCHATTVTQNLTCPQNFSGQIIQTNTASCPDPYGQQVWSGFVTTTNSCTPNPATCIPSTQTQTLSCQTGYIGAISQTRVSSCGTPYSVPTWSAWSTTTNTCVLSPTNPMNMTSVQNPVSPVSPVTKPVTQTPTDTTQVANTVQVTQAAAMATTATTSVAPATQQSATSTPSSSPPPKGKDLVPGLGLVTSLTVLNKPALAEKLELKSLFDYQQELPYELRGNQGFLLDLITESDISDAFNNLASDRWDSLRRYNDLQPDYSGD